MANKIVVAIVLLACVHLSTQNNCGPGVTITSTDEKLDWKNPKEPCLNQFQNQIQMELEASIAYLTMSAHFSHASTHRPNAAKFFLDSAYEERSHAKHLIEYLLMRGGELSPENPTIKTIKPNTTERLNLEMALEAALDLEFKVTASINEIIRVCGAEPGRSDAPLPSPLKHDQKNDYHAVDYLTGDFLKEQHEGTRQLAGYLATLRKMKIQYGNFAEIIFDKSLAA